MQLNPRATTALGFIFGMGMFSPMFICRSRNSPGLLAALSPSQGDPGDCTHRHNVWFCKKTSRYRRIVYDDLFIMNVIKVKFLW